MGLAKYLNELPNGSSFQQGLGHPGDDSSKTSAFANAFATAGHTWSASLCAEKFPSSTMTNGAAFGDPCCTWKKGGTPDFTVTAFTTSPTKATTCASSSGTKSSTASSSASAPASSSAGRLDLVILGQNGQKLLELTASTTSVRDLWVQTLEELYLPGQSEQNEEDAKNLNEKMEKQQEKQNEQYWKDRTQELEKRRLDAEERKKKIGVIGMKYTAQAMAKR
ncbi:hypothetical protein BBI17_000177 [Phytophthora kernoviae]|nr:hypothetical protein BBI17_000177 [Phytophthora kernoviae]